MRWRHSAAQLADGLTKTKVEARADWDLLVRRGWLWKLTYDPDFMSAKRRNNNCKGILDDCIAELTPDMDFEETWNVDLAMYQPEETARGVAT